MDVAPSKKHACQWPGCSKAFSRSDHLQRHRLNHSSQGSTCQRCRAHFKRPDLLDRHMTRHQQRDLEAGGEGLGVVETRKRLWEDANGNVVKNRPSTPPPGHRCRKRRRSEPKKGSSKGPSSDSSSKSPTVEISMPLVEHVASNPQLEEPAMFPELFDQNVSEMPESWGLMSPPNSVVSTEFSQCTDFESLFALPVSNPQAIDSMSCETSDGTISPSDIQLASATQDQLFFPASTPDSLDGIVPWPNFAADGFNTNYPPVTSGPVPVEPHSKFVQTFYHCNPQRQMPLLDEACRERVLEIITGAGVCHTDGMLLTASSPLLSLSAMQNYSDLFFSDFNDTTPIIHRPSFQPAAAEPLLLLAILLLGAIVEGRTTSDLAMGIYDALPAAILQQHVMSQSLFTSRMQTLLLYECIGRLKGNQRQQEMARVYHTLLVQLLGRSNCAELQRTYVPVEGEDLDSMWRTEMQLEERKRVVYFCFVADTQSSMAFSRNASMSVSDLRLSLPCCPAAWEADSAEQWREYADAEPTQLPFYSLLQDYQNLECTQLPTKLHALSHVLILYGLMAISMEVKRREQALAACNAMSDENLSGNRFVASLRTWKANLDAYRIDVRTSFRSTRLAQSSTLDLRFRSFISDATILYHTASAFLSLGSCDMYASVSSPGLYDNFRRNHDYQQNAHWPKSWLSGQLASHGAWHAGYAIREVVLDDGIPSLSGLFNSALSLYVSLLVCCSFYLLQDETGQASPFDQGQDIAHATQTQPTHSGETWHAARQMGFAILTLTNVNIEMTTMAISKDQLKALCVGIEEYLRCVHSPALKERARALSVSFCNNSSANIIM